MKIAAIATSQIPSTTANSIQVMKACQGLAQNDCQVHLFIPGVQPTAWDELADQYGIQTPFAITWISENRLWRRYDFALKAVWEARRLQPSLIYTWQVQAGVLSLLYKVPVILEVHDRPAGRLGPTIYRWFVQMRGNKLLACITRALQERIVQDTGPIPAEGTIIAPNGVELERYADLPDPSSARRLLGLPEKPTAVYTGHFYAGRGMDVLFSLAQAFPDTSFLWIGGRPQDVEAWRGCLESSGVQNVRLTGFVENKRLPLYQAAGDVLLMPYERSIAGSSGGNSADICSPMKMFEYMAAGRAILTSDLPVLHEVLNEGNVVFCPPEDSSAWNQALAGLLADPPRRETLARQARKDAEQYTWRERARRILASFG